LKATYTNSPLSWGRVDRHKQKIYTPHWRSDLIPLVDQIPSEETYLPYGLGRSYGDSCLNKPGSLVKLSGINRVRSFDRETGLIVADAGCSLENILAVIVPSGWFLPVSPGTKYVTLGGAIANDVHGKNHHVAGTFGRHVSWIEILRSTGEVLQAGPTQNLELFQATIGGLGLTGIIQTVALQLQPISSPWMRVETIPLRSLDDYFRLADESDELFPYTVSWIDCLATGKDVGKGLLIRGEHAPAGVSPLKAPRQLPRLSLPLDAPSWLLGKYTVGTFNRLYYQMGLRKEGVHFENYDAFFYPLDGVLHWNKMYGRKGFYQLQFTVPLKEADVIGKALSCVAKWGTSSFLVVLKKFGTLPSPGLLSFPSEGYTLTLDFANRGEMTEARIRELMEMALKAGGRVYPAKDALMTPAAFEQGFAVPPDFTKWQDERIASDFWRRVRRNS